MAKATFANIELTVNIRAGTLVIEVSEKVGCWECGCGACVMKVEEEWNNLSEPSVLEDKVLYENMAGRHYRLACQTQVVGDIKVRPA